MATFYSNYPGSDLAQEAAALIAAQSTELSDAMVLVPTRRASLALRDAFRRQSPGQSLLLPRIVSLADIGDELLGLLPPSQALSILQALPPPMRASTRRYLLAAQVMAFEQARHSHGGVEQALRLAEYLADLQDRATRAGVALTPETLAPLFPGDYATHWKQSLAFLNIVTEIWPGIEAEEGAITAAAHEVQLLTALRDAWAENPPDAPVFAVGSTASQPTTRALLATIAQMPRGAVVLPGLDARLRPQAWATVHESHPYYYMKQLLDDCGVTPDAVPMLGVAPPHCSIWLEALACVESMPQWGDAALPEASWSGIRLVPCRHSEEEARSIALLLREAVQVPGERAALITPDESLMARVAAQLQQFGLSANRLAQGTLAQTETGSLAMALLELMDAPESTRLLFGLLRHPNVRLGPADAWPGWLDMAEQNARGVPTHRAGQMPQLPAVLRDTPAYVAVADLLREVHALSRTRLHAGQWSERIAALLGQLQATPGQAQERIEALLEQCAEAELLGPIDISGYAGLVRDGLAESWRGPQFSAHPDLFMLTPVEARLQRFDRVVLGGMTERLWPGVHTQSPWLNLAQQAQLGLPGVAEHATLMAHDVLMLGSSSELFLSYPQREAGSPAARSRFIERLVTLLAMQGVAESAITAGVYAHWAQQLHSTAEFAPEPPPQPRPPTRPAELSVSQLDDLFSDPYSIYARSILGLRSLDDLDAEPDLRDFGTIAHGALKQLAEHWTAHGVGPDVADLKAMADAALAHVSERPSVQLFWQARLQQALAFVNDEEAQRRDGKLRVQPELPVAQPLADLGITLRGRIDRLEQGPGGCVVGDYKTGQAPSLSAIKRGEAVQLLAYAMLLAEAEAGAMPHALEYWSLPAGLREGEITQLAWSAEEAAELTGKLRTALAQFMDTTTPLLARPLANTDRYTNDYDGISRYDEWAG